MILVPKGFAHGFISLVEKSEIIYLVSEFYSKEHEGSLNSNEPQIAIKWLIKPNYISEKDQKAPIVSAITPIIV